MALISSTSVGGGAGGTTGSIDTTGATFLVAIGVADSGVPSISDSKGNTWSHLTTRGGSFPTYHRLRISYVNNPTVGTGHTFTCAGTNASACFAAFDSTAIASVFEAENGAQNLGVSSATGGSPGTPANANSLIISGLGVESASVSASVGSSFTLAVSQPHVGGVSYGCFLAYKISSGSEDPAWSLGGTFDVNVANAIFKPSGGGGGGGTVARAKFMPLLGAA